MIGPVVDAVAGELLPIARPVDAEAAIAVIDQERQRTGGRLFRGRCGLISGCLLHVLPAATGAKSLFDAAILGQIDGPGNEGESPFIVTAGLVPAIHVLGHYCKIADARDFAWA